MRPYSIYLDLLKSESISAKFNLAGSTPPLPLAWTEKVVRISMQESLLSPSYDSVLRLLADRLAAPQNEVTICPGGSQSILQALAAVTVPGDYILIEHPVYEPFVSVVKFLGLKVRFFSRSGEFDRDWAEISRRCRGTKVILLSNPHCPTGNMYDADALLRLARLGPFLIVDEVFLPIFAGGKATMARHRKIISVGGMSKSLGLSSLRLGWVCASSNVIKDIIRVGYNLHVDMPTASVQLAEIALRDWDKITTTLIHRADTNRSLVLEFARRNPNAIPFGFDRGHFFVLRVPRPFKSALAFSKALLKHSVWVRAGGSFGMPRFVRVHVLLPPRDFVKAFSEIERFYVS